MKVTELPLHIVCVPLVIAILTVGVNTGFTVIGILLLFTVTGLAQVALLVNTQVTRLVLARVVLV